MSQSSSHITGFGGSQLHSGGRRLLLTGSSGTIGRGLQERASAAGWQVFRLVRRSANSPDEIQWQPDTGELDKAALAAAAPTAVVHLAGESVFGWWSKAKRRRILDSRVRSTRLVVEAIRGLPRPPAVLASASAVGFYGDGRDAVIDESAPGGRGFLAEVCRAWEEEAAAAESLGVRVALLRIGVVLSPVGGALAAMVPMYRAGLGGPVAGGKPWIPWISLTDTLRAIEHVVCDDGMRGPVNVVGPAPVTQGEFSRALAAKLRRPAIVPVPRWLAATALGEMARETALKSVRAVPRRLLDAGFQFSHASLDSALDAALAAKPQEAADRKHVKHAGGTC